MIKKLFTIFFSLMFIFSLTACHGSKGLAEFSAPEDFDTSMDFEIAFWAKNDTNKTQTNIYEKAISDFEKLYPNIKINMRLYTDYGKIYNDVITNISTKTTPNVCITYPDHIATYLSGENVVVPLDDLLKNEKYGLAGSELLFDSPSFDELIPNFLNECILEDSYYALPFMRSSEACYINKTFVEKLGFEIPEKLTWDFLWQVSEAATKQDVNGYYNVNAQKVMIPFIYKSTDNMMIQMLRQKGAGYSDESGEILIFYDTTKEILYEIAKHAKSGAFSTFKISSYPANFLNAGQCIFAIDSTAGATWMGSHAPLRDISEEDIVNFETVVMPIPQFDTENPQMISQGPSICIFNKSSSEEVLASWLFAQYLITNDVQVSYAQTEGYVPVTLKAQNSAEYTDYLSRRGEDNSLYYNIKIDASKLILDNIANTFVTPVFAGSASLRSASGQLIENVAKSVRRKETIDDLYIENLYKDVTSLYRLNEKRDNFESGKVDLGKLPKASKILIYTLISVWFLLAIYIFVEKARKKILSKQK